VPEAASDLPDQVRQVVPLEQRELRRGRKVLQDRFRRRVASEYLNVNDSARRRLPAQVKVSSAVEVRRLDFVNR
jgi:hypothetical protein